MSPVFGGFAPQNRSLDYFIRAAVQFPPPLSPCAFSLLPASRIIDGTPPVPVECNNRKL